MFLVPQNYRSNSIAPVFRQYDQKYSLNFPKETVLSVVYAILDNFVINSSMNVPSDCSDFKIHSGKISNNKKNYEDANEYDMERV